MADDSSDQKVSRLTKTNAHYAGHVYFTDDQNSPSPPKVYVSNSEDASPYSHLSAIRQESPAEHPVLAEINNMMAELNE